MKSDWQIPDMLHETLMLDLHPVERLVYEETDFRISFAYSNQGKIVLVRARVHLHAYVHVCVCSCMCS